MKTPKYTKLFVALVCASVLPLSLQAIPNALTLGDAIGYIAPGVDAASIDGTASVNSLLLFAGGGSDPSGGGLTYFVVTLGSYATAVYADQGGGAGNGIGLNASYDYLAVKYDGSGGTLQVWDIFGLTGTLTVPALDENQTSPNVYYLFNAGATVDPRGVPGTVPDGGSTVALLGLALIGLYLIRRQIASC